MMYKILVTDDNTDVVDILKKRLIQEGYEVIVAFDGDEAIIKIKEGKPDVVLLDLMMPKVNGFEVLKELRRLREEEKDKWRPVIIISAKNELEAIMKCYNLQADLYLSKPCSLDDILNAIKRMITLISLRIK